jgi:hypothetical protein
MFTALVSMLEAVAERHPKMKVTFISYPWERFLVLHPITNLQKLEEVLLDHFSRARGAGKYVTEKQTWI